MTPLICIIVNCACMCVRFSVGLVGILFPDKSEKAYSVHRIWLAVGAGTAFVIAEVLDLSGRCYFVLVAVSLAVASNIVLEFKTQPKKALLPSCLSNFLH